jgi:hypothetical protein
MTTLQLPTDHYLAGGINAVHLKHRFGDVEPIVVTVCIDSSSESWELYQPRFHGTQLPVEEPCTAS